MNIPSVFLPGDGLGSCASISESVIGLPDNAYCDNTGRPCSERIEHFLGLNRSSRRKIAAISQGSSVMVYGKPETRLLLLRRRVGSSRRKHDVIPLQNDLSASWEAIVFSSFLKGWHLSDSAAEEYPAYLQLSDADRERLSAAALAKFNKLKPETVTARSKTRLKSAAQQDDADDLPVLVKCAARVFAELLVQLKTWDDESPDRRTLLANVAFGCFTLFGREALAVCIDQVPDLKSYYSVVWGDKVRSNSQDRATVASPESPPTGGSPVLVPSSVVAESPTLEELYRRIVSLADTGVQQPVEIDCLMQIQALIDENLPRLKKAAQLDPVFAQKIIREVISALEHIGGNLHPIFADPTFIKAFHGGWIKYFGERLKQTVEHTYFNGLVEERYVATAGNSLLTESLSSASAENQQYNLRIETLEASIRSANFREKRELEAQRLELQIARTRALNDLHQLEEQALAALLPPDSSLEALPDSDEVAFDFESLNQSLAEALRTWSWTFPDTDDQADEPTKESVSNEIQSAQEAITSAAADESLEVEQTSETSAAEDGATINDGIALVGEPHAAEEKVGPDQQPFTREDPKPSVAPPEIEPALSGLDLTHYFESADAARERLKRCRSETSPVPGIAVENIAILWFDRGHLNFACRVLEIADQIDTLGNDRLPASLFRAAFHGMNVWRGDYATIARVLRHLDAVAPKETATWIDRKPGGRVVPYLVFAATFQPAIFAGNMTPAPRVLGSIASYFEAPIARLIEEVIHFSDRNYRLDVDSLRNAPKGDEKSGRIKLSEQVLEWRDRVVNKQTGWAPARKAMKEILSRDDFEIAVRAITKDDASLLEAVKEFADQYRDVEAQTQLMRDSIFSMTSENPSPSQIEGNARSWFLRTVDELIGHADAWVNEHIQQVARGDEASKFARRFSTISASAITHLKEKLERTSDFEKVAGLRLACQAIENVARVSDGDLSVAWDSKRADAWLALPKDLFSDLGFVDDPISQMAWLENSVDELNFATLAAEAAQRKNFRQASLIQLYRRDVLQNDIGTSLEDLDVSFAEEKRQLLKRCELLKNMLDNANIGSLITDERHYQLSSDVEHLQEHLKVLGILDAHSEILASLESYDKEVTERFGGKISELQAELDELVSRARTEQGTDSVPASWLDNFRRALSQREITVAEEMLDHLKRALEARSPLQAEVHSPSNYVKQFLEAEHTFYPLLRGVTNPREVVRELSSLESSELKFNASTPYLRAGMEAVVTLRKRFRSLDKETYEQIVYVLHLIGLELVSPAFTTTTQRISSPESHGNFTKIKLQIRRAETARGFAFFDSEIEEQQGICVILASTDWSIADLSSLFEEQSLTLDPDRNILISGKVLSVDERNAFANLCKRRKQTIYLADAVVLAMLGCLTPSGPNRLKTFLQLTLPWTYLNPYTGSQMQHARPEMRYGRQDDIRLLTAMRNGAAIIYGGRQLGKTTLLNETHRQFNKPGQGQHAFLYQMDGNLDRLNLSGNELEKHRSSVWSNIYGGAVDRKLIPAETFVLNTDGKRDAIVAYFRQPNAEKVMVCFDEIDPILGLDAANGFSIFRELSGLVNTSNDRFKVIIAGLENVRRFADAPNYPLHQLGSAIQVSIMTPSEALQLIREPLSNLGYEFDSVLLINRVMVETNRHPGLIHIFCHELIKHLATRSNARVGDIVITSEDIETISRDPTVRELISNRFEITLNLDQRYKLIAFSLIEQGTSTFTSTRAKSIVEVWAPEVFRKMTEGQFEAFLDELCGLGVLHYLRRVEGGKEYGLRNANILNLAGGRTKIAEKLLRAIDSIRDDDPMSGHAFPKVANLPSPLTLRDEKTLIGEEPASVERARTASVIAKSSSYSVGIIVGSEALGLSSDWMLSTLPEIGLEEPNLESSQPARYTGESRKDTEFSDTQSFRRILVETIVQKRSITQPMMFIVVLTGDMPISHSLDLIDIAHEARLSHPTKGQRVRVVFLLQPKALWQWICSSHLTFERETMQPFVALDRWSKTAMAHLLNRLALENTTADIDELYESSQGWFVTMKDLVDVRAKKSQVTRLRSLGAPSPSFTSPKSKQMTEFLSKAGLTSVSWAIPLLSSLPMKEAFDEDDVALQLMELKLDADVKDVIRWLTTLRLIDSKRNNLFKVTESVAKAIESRVGLPANA